MLEGPHSILYRTFLLIAMPVVVLLAAGFHVGALYALAAAVFGLLAAAWMIARRHVHQIEVRRELYPSAFEEDRVVVDLVVENRGRVAAHLLEMVDHFGPGLAERQLIMEAGPLGSMRRRRLSYEGSCSRHWGVYTVGPLEITAADPMGLFHATRALPEVDVFSVFPRVYDVAGLERLGAIPSLTPQEASAGRPGQGAVFLGAREYRAGDDLRRIHWPATARRGALVLKEYEVDLVPYFTLFLDLNRGNRAGTGKKSTLEYVVRVAASLVWSAVRRGDMVQVFGEGTKPLFVPPGRGEMHLATALNELIQVQQDGTTPLLEVVERHVAHLPPGSTAALLSGTISVELPRLAETLEVLRSRAVRPLLVLVNSTSFMPLDKWPLPRAEALERCREVEYFLRSRGVPGVIVGAEQDLEQELGRPDLFWTSHE